MIIIKRIFLSLLLLLSIVSCSNESEKAHKPLRVAYISHTYFVNQFPDIQDRIINEINEANPDYVFALGDIVLRNKDEFWEGTLAFFARLNAPVYYAPGNHDLNDYDVIESFGTNRHYPKWRDEYIERIGYVNKLVKDPRADFILINSSDPIALLKPFLDDSLKKANPDTPNVLLTHHHIWIPRYQVNWASWPYKNNKKEEMLPYIRQMSQVVAGDLKGQLEIDYIGKVPVAMVGIGNMDKLPFWVLSELGEDGNFTFKQITTELDPEHPYIYRK